MQKVIDLQEQAEIMAAIEQSDLEQFAHPESTNATLGGLLPDFDKEALTRGRFCPMPFEFAQVDPQGYLFGCCPAWLFAPLGNLRVQPFMEAWNSTIAQRVRESILDGSFKFCNVLTCNALSSGQLPRIEALTDPAHLDIVRERKTVVQGPRELNLAYDLSCNLGCPSCRSTKIIAKGDSRAQVEAIHANVLSGNLDGLKRLHITGSGDPFVSRVYLDFLRTFDPSKHPDIRITLCTNGVLLTPQMWDTLCHPAIDTIDCSIDAATAETYAKNRGGNFTRLLDNLAFLGEKRRSGALENLRLHFVVQENNVDEMLDFIDLGARVYADAVAFKQLQNWDSYDPDDYLRRAVQFPTHPRHEELLDVLDDPVFESPMVWAGDLDYLAPEARIPFHSPCSNGRWKDWRRLAEHLYLSQDQVDNLLSLARSTRNELADLISEVPAPTGNANARAAEALASSHQKFQGQLTLHQQWLLSHIPFKIVELELD